MASTIQKWGNSQAVRLPKAILDMVSLKENDPVQIMVENDRIIIKKANNTLGHKSLKQRVEEFYGKDFEAVIIEHSYEYEEVGWGPPVGTEEW